MAGEEIAELQQSEKFVKEISAAKMRQPSMITGDPEVSRRSSHPEPYLTKSEVRLRVAKAERKTDKHSPRPILETWECAGFRYQGTTSVVPISRLFLSFRADFSPRGICCSDFFSSLLSRAVSTRLETGFSR